MKQILIINNNMHIGGVQKSLVNLLRNISSDYKVTLLLFSKQGELLPDIPDTVSVITAKSPYAYFGLVRGDKMTLVQKIGRAFFAAITRIFGRSCAVMLMSMFQKQLNGYDTAISFLHSGNEKSFYGGCNEFVIRHVNAKEKITFLHCDFGEINANTPQNKRIYEGFDKIAACSEGCKRAFLKQFPHLKERVSVVENFCDFETICCKAKESPVNFDKDHIHIVTVARLGREKGVDRGVQAIAGLGDLRKKVHYHIIGTGIEYSLIQQLINNEDIGNVVTMYGSRENPYGFIKAADILLIPSLSEAAPMVINEAAALGTPILSTKTSSALEMIDYSGFGWVCKNSVEGITEALSDLLNDNEKIIIKKQFLSSVKLNNQNAENQFAKLIND